MKSLDELISEVLAARGPLFEGYEILRRVNQEVDALESFQEGEGNPVAARAMTGVHHKVNVQMQKIAAVRTALVEASELLLDAKQVSG